MRLGVRVGQACAKIHDEKMRGVSCQQLECDEIWGFIGAKRRNADRSGNFGDRWTFIALDCESKLIPSFLVGKRDMYHARAFMDDLAGRMANLFKFQQMRWRLIPMPLNVHLERKPITGRW
jgi:hypothetical protein